MPEALVKVVKFVCPVCQYSVFIYFDELQKNYGFNGDDFNKLLKIDCHICHRSQAVAKEVQEVPDCYADPLEIWLENHH